MSRALVFLIMLPAFIACNASKYHGMEPDNNEVDSLPPTIIAPAKYKPVLADTTSLYDRDFFELDEERDIVIVSGRRYN